MESSHGTEMGDLTKESGRRTECMDKGYSNGKMVGDILAAMWLIRKKATENSYPTSSLRTKSRR